MVLLRGWILVGHSGGDAGRGELRGASGIAAVRLQQLARRDTLRRDLAAVDLMDAAFVLVLQVAAGPHAEWIERQLGEVGIGAAAGETEVPPGDEVRDLDLVDLVGIALRRVADLEVV